MNKEELFERVFTIGATDVISIAALNEFLSQNVCIPKGENRHPHADVLHEWAEGNVVDVTGKYKEVVTQLEKLEVLFEEGQISNSNFTEYGFINPTFDGKIIGVSDEKYYIGYYIEEYPCVVEPQKIPCFWNKVTGSCYKGAGVNNSKYSLKNKLPEPVYEWQWCWLGEVNTMPSSYFTDKEIVEKFTNPSVFIKIEETKRIRQ